MSKYNRHQPVISRSSDDSVSEDYWFKRFEQTLERSAVQPRSVEVSLFDQINSIMNGSRAKYPSVEAAVEDMKERSGLKAYLEKINKTSSSDDVESSTIKSASANVPPDLTPVVIKKCPQIKTTFENYIRDTKGNLPIPAIIDKVRSIHQNDVSEAGDWDDDKLLRFVSRLNLVAKTNNPAAFDNYSTLGTYEAGHDDGFDPSNTDSFHGLNPVKF